MIFKPFTIVLTCCLALCAAVVVPAQESTKLDIPRFRTFGWQVAPADLFYEVGGKDVPIQIIDSTRSQFYDLGALKSILFYRVTTNAEGKKVRQPVVTADVSAAGRWPLLVFLADKAAGADALRVVALSDDLESFPAPQFRFVNFTPVQMGLTLGKERVVLPPRELHVLDPALVAGQAATTRYFVISIATEEGPKMLYANNWVVRPSQRTLVLIFAEDGALQIRRVVDDVTQYPSPAEK